MITINTLLLLTPCYFSLFFMLQLARGKKFIYELPKCLLFVFMLGVFIFSISFLFFYSSNFVLLKWSHSTYVALIILFHPLFYMYVKSLVCSKIYAWEYLLHFAPSIVAFISISIIEILLPFKESTFYYTHHLLGIIPESQSHLLELLNTIFLATKKIHAFQAVLYFILIHRALKSQSKLLRDLFSYGEKYNLSWLFTFNFSYAIVSIIGIVATLLPSDVADKDSIFMLLNMLIFAFFTLFIGLKGSEQESTLKEVNENDDKINISETTSDNDAVVLMKIEKYLHNEKAYLNPELTIWDVVTHISINRTYISKIINQHYKQNFSQLINYLRIKEACSLLECEPKYTFETIAVESGFNSISTFNRAFKSFKGKTPSEYRFENSL